MNGVWLIWGDRQASRISYIPLLSMATRFTRIYGVHLATAADHGIFAFCGFDGPREYPGWLWPIEAFYCVGSPVDRIACLVSDVCYLWQLKQIISLCFIVGLFCDDYILLGYVRTIVD